MSPRRQGSRWYPDLIRASLPGVFVLNFAMPGEEMDIAYISALSALTGSVIGGLTSGTSTWLGQRAQARSVTLAQDKSRREELYRDFIITATKLYADALMHDDPKVPDIVALYALVSRMRITSSSRIIACAERITSSATDAYFMPNRSIRELHEMIKSDSDAVDPLREFSELAREELQTIRPI